ncbi:DUF6095 family protein [Arenibacter latericius]|uniref:DUF6095 family protein n=1 Tax=Arenibacter latericius TaxID=86104 RepID=UPI000410E98C|nr:DUF6095 family protein [Arenibacter latericius]MDX1364802.1 DUF6095 family protein [Arenibacter latericius]
MRTNKDLLVKGLKFLAYTLFLMFTAPVVIYQAFKNEGHPLYWPVLIIGIILAIAAVSMGFYSIKIVMDSLFQKKSEAKNKGLK